MRLRNVIRYLAAFPAAMYAAALARRNDQPIDLSQIKRVLVVRLDEIGDVVLTIPMLRELRRNLPNARITLLVKPLVHNLVEHCPYVDEVLTFDVSRGPLLRHWRAWRQTRRGFDLAVLPRWDADRYHGAFVTRLSGARWRVGYSVNVSKRKRQFNRGYDRLFTHTIFDVRPRHEVERNLDVVRFLGGTVRDDKLELWLDDQDQQRAKEFLPPGQQPVAFGPGKGDLKRRWPAANFAELGRVLHTPVVVVGGKGDPQLGEPFINAVGQLTLRQTAALLKHCRLFVGNDSGPKHLAAAMGVPVVEINAHPIDGSPLHLHSPARFGPWGVPHQVLQPLRATPPCSSACTASGPHCILAVTIEQVKDAVLGRPLDFPKITIVTPSFNQAQFLEETIRSVLSANYPNLEYIIMDGGSTDGSADIIRKYEKQLAYWTSEPDQGQADAINKGWRRGTGEILAYINSDDTYQPGALRLIAEAFARDPELGLVYGRCNVIDEHSAVLRERRVRDAIFAELLRWSPSIPQPTMFVRRSAIQPLNVDLHYTMDYDLTLRVGMKHKLQFIPHVLANMRDHPAAKTARDPLKHVEEGLAVATIFFQQPLPADFAALRARTLATLNIRRARVLSRLGRSAEARAIIADALDRCPDVRREAVAAWTMSLLGANAIAGLRRLKRGWLKQWE